MHIAAFYKFAPVTAADLQPRQTALKQFGLENDLRGLVLLAEEGINGTVCGRPEAVAQWKKLLISFFGEMNFNDSQADGYVFPRWFVKIREEIVTLNEDVDANQFGGHLSPEEWDAMLESEDVVVLDARNVYETAIGTFDGAIDPGLRHFHEFPEYAAKAELPKDKPILMYCTGGIRCEKASVELKKQGYSNVFQLKGGILSYLKKFPNKRFKGECFVFDHRVSVDQELKPSQQYGLCPHCGDPGDQQIVCEQCETQTLVCTECLAQENMQTCSKRCRNELRQKSALVRS